MRRNHQLFTKDNYVLCQKIILEVDLSLEESILLKNINDELLITINKVKDIIGVLDYYFKISKRKVISCSIVINCTNCLFVNNYNYILLLQELNDVQEFLCKAFENFVPIYFNFPCLSLSNIENSVENNNLNYNKVFNTTETLDFILNFVKYDEGVFLFGNNVIDLIRCIYESKYKFLSSYLYFNFSFNNIDRNAINVTYSRENNLSNHLNYEFTIKNSKQQFVTLKKATIARKKNVIWYIVSSIIFLFIMSYSYLSASSNKSLLLETEHILQRSNDVSLYVSKTSNQEIDKYIKLLELAKNKIERIYNSNRFLNIYGHIYFNADILIPVLESRISDLQYYLSYNQTSIIELLGYESGSYRLSDINSSKLDEVINSINSDRWKRIVIIGYADLKGNRKNNMFLSYKRAETIKDWIERKLGDSNNILVEIKAKGSYKPKYIENKKNRRVEIVLYK